MKLYLSAALALLMACASPASAFAQGELGRVAGIVRDSSSAFVPGAKVLVKNEKTGEERTAVTNAQGFFLIGSLRPATYTIKVDMGAGFAPIEYTAMPITAGQELTPDSTAGRLPQSVTVTGISPVLDMSSASMGASVSTREVDGLPVNGRQMSQLLLQAPGACRLAPDPTPGTLASSPRLGGQADDRDRSRVTLKIHAARGRPSPRARRHDADNKSERS